MLSFSGGKPGNQPLITNQPREVFRAGRDRAQFLALPLTIDGTLSSNPQNSPYQFYLFAGTLLGKVTSSRKFANSILGLTSTTLGGGQTSVTTDVNTAAEIVRRIGASGTFTLTGGYATNGPASQVRQRTITYSAVNTTTGVVTVSADFQGSSGATNQVNSIPFVDSTGSGTFTITVEGITTPAITYSSTAATLFANINTQLNAAFGTSAIVASGASLAAIILTFSGNTYAGRPVGTVQATILAASTGYTINGSGTVGTPSTCLVTTAGAAAVAVDGGDFAVGSAIGPTDGSQNILTMICDVDGIKCADGTNVNRVDAYDPQLLAAGGTINAGFIVNYGSDTGLNGYIKSQIKAACGGVTFDDDWT